MREMRFRGKRRDNGEWVYGYLLYDQEQNEAFIAEYFEDKSAYIREVIPGSVGEFTGLKDVNGKEIFEGDLVKQFNRGAGGIVSEAIFQNGAFGYVAYSGFISYAENSWFDWKDGSSDEIEVVGNRFENPDLLGDPHE